MKKLLTFWMLALLPFCINAQNDAKAAEVLDKTLTELSGNSGIRTDFEGTESGGRAYQVRDYALFTQRKSTL